MPWKECNIVEERLRFIIKNNQLTSKICLREAGARNSQNAQRLDAEGAL